jgi:hypothetical protein
LRYDFCRIGFAGDNRTAIRAPVHTGTHVIPRKTRLTVQVLATAENTGYEFNPERVFSDKRTETKSERGETDREILLTIPVIRRSVFFGRREP